MTGRKFFRALVRATAACFRVRHVFVTECLGTPPRALRMLAFFSDERFAEPFTYDLEDTPCRLVMERGGIEIFGRCVRQAFPEDDDLVTLEAESYIGVPLFANDGRVIGHLALVDDQPARDFDRAGIELVAARAAAELERLRAVERLARSEARLRQVIDLVPHFIFAKDADGRFLLANQAVAEAYGVPIDDLLGRTDAAFARESDEADRFVADDREVLRSGARRLIPEETLTDASGRRRVLQTVKIPFDFGDDGTPAVLGVSTDVTEIRRAEGRLRSVVEGTASTTGNAFFRSLVQHLAQALDVRYVLVGELVGRDVRTRAVWANGGIGEPIEYPLVGSPCEEVTTLGVQCVYPSGVAENFPNDHLLVELGAEGYFGTPLFDFEGGVLGLIAVVDDKTLSIDLQDQYLLSIFASRAAAELERQRIEEQSRQLEAQVLHVQKLESLGVLAGGIAHDFNNLLAGVLGNAGLLRMQLGDGSALRQLVREIESAAERAAELANQMLAYSGKGRFVVENHDINRLVRDVEGLLRSSVSKKADLAFDLAEGLPAVEADATQLRQVVMNLVTNASDAIDASGGGGTIRARTRLVRLDDPERVAAYVGDPPAPGRYLVLEVEDDGAGMSHATSERLFEPFFTTKATGRGLGMSAVLGIIRGHRGAITVESSPGDGSLFRIFLPVAEAPADRASDDAEVETPPTDDLVPERPRRILVIEDESVVRTLARRILERAGYEVLEAANGFTGLELADREGDRLDALLLDLTMPRLDGREVLRALRDGGVDVPVVLTSGYTDLDEMPEVAEDGVSFLKKPYRPKELEAAIRAALHPL
ncbi:MAG: response regulator [Acidobacteriota bacterium]